MRKTNEHQVQNALIEMDGGKVIATIQSELERVVAEVSSRFAAKASGSVTLKIDIKRNGEDMVEVLPNITTKLPGRGMRNHVFFFGQDGTLHRRNPEQGDIEDVITLSQTKKDT